MEAGLCYLAFFECLQLFDSQDVFIGPVPNANATGQRSTPPLIHVTLLHDLCNRVALGDPCDVIGHPLCLQQQSAADRMFAFNSVVANNLLLASPESVIMQDTTPCSSPSFSSPCHSQPQEGCIQRLLSFNAVMHRMLANGVVNCITSDSMNGEGCVRVPSLLPLALLMSLVAAAGTTQQALQALSPIEKILGVADQSEQGVCWRTKINVLLVAAEPCSLPMKLLMQAAKLAARSVSHPMGVKPPVGRHLLAKKVSADEQPLIRSDTDMVAAGSLPLGSGGVVLMDVSRGRVRGNTAQLLERAMGQHTMMSDSGRFRIGCGTVWATSVGYAFVKQRRSECSSISGNFQVNRKDPSLLLLPKFDIVITTDITSGYIELQTDKGDIAEVLLELKEELSRISHQSTCMSFSDNACSLLHAYYVIVRRSVADRCLDGVTLTTLQSLLRMTLACAKLCSR